MAGATDGKDADRFDEYCDHLPVREDASVSSSAATGCCRRPELSPPEAFTHRNRIRRAFARSAGRIAGRDGPRGCREDHRNGGVVLLMWAGILAYLDRCGYDYVTGCVSVSIAGSADEKPGSQIRGVRDFVLRRHAARRSTRCTRTGR